MLKGVKAKIGMIVVGILIVCGATVGIINTFADPNYSILTVEFDPWEPEDLVVELDGTNGYEFGINLIAEDYNYIVRNVEGNFNVANPYITASSCSGGVNESLCDIDTGHFSLEYDGDEPLYYINKIRYTISPDTPAGVYDLSVNINDFRAQIDDDDLEEPYYIDLSETTPNTDAKVIVRRPQEVIFKDANGNPITEITKYYIFMLVKSEALIFVLWQKKLIYILKTKAVLQLMLKRGQF